MKNLRKLTIFGSILSQDFLFFFFRDIGVLWYQNMLGNVDDQFVYIKILYIVIFIDIDFSDDFLSTGLKRLERDDDPIADLFISDDPCESCDVIDTDLDWSVDEVDKDFLLVMKMIKNENKSIVIFVSIEFF
jgi:hypothetical protein